MINPSFSSQCHACGANNGENQKFCNQCGTSLVQLCRSCRAENKLSAAFCGSCGVRLAEARLSFSEDELDHWNKTFDQFWGYCWLHADNGIYRTITREPALAYAANHNPPLMKKGGENVVIKIPIADKDWCVRSVRKGSINLTNGVFYIPRDRILMMDPASHRHIVVYFSEMVSVSHSQRVLSIATHSGETLEVEFQIPKVDNSGVRAAKVGYALNFLGGLINDFSDKNYTDKKLDEYQYEKNMSNNSRDIADFEKRRAKQEWEINHFVEYIARPIQAAMDLKNKYGG